MPIPVLQMGYGVVPTIFTQLLVAGSSLLLSGDTAHVLLIRMDADAWTVQTGSGVWATRLRYVLYDIRDVLGLHIGIALPKPHIQITPVVAAPAPPRTRTLTRQAARCLEETARNETDPRLSAALMRLAGRAGP